MFRFVGVTPKKAVLVTVSAGLSASLPAGECGIWSTSTSAPVCTECCEAGQPGLFDRYEDRADRLVDRIRKAPFDHYAHNPGDLSKRPICPPFCSPTAGYHEPNWRQLPDMKAGYQAVYSESPVAYPAYSEPSMPNAGLSSPVPMPPAAPPSGPADQDEPMVPNHNPQNNLPPGDLDRGIENPFPAEAAPPAAFLPPLPPGAGPSLNVPPADLPISSSHIPQRY